MSADKRPARTATNGTVPNVERPAQRYPEGTVRL